MRTHMSADVIGTEAGNFSLAWEETRCWARRVLCGKGATSAAIVIGATIASLGALGLLEYKLYQLMENWTTGGAGVSLFAFF